MFQNQSSETFGCGLNFEWFNRLTWWFNQGPTRQHNKRIFICNFWYDVILNFHFRYISNLYLSYLLNLYFLYLSWKSCDPQTSEYLFNKYKFLGATLWILRMGFWLVAETFIIGFREHAYFWPFELALCLTELSNGVSILSKCVWKLFCSVASLMSLHIWCGSYSHRFFGLSKIWCEKWEYVGA